MKYRIVEIECPEAKQAVERQNAGLTKIVRSSVVVEQWES